MALRVLGAKAAARSVTNPFHSSLNLGDQLDHAARTAALRVHRLLDAVHKDVIGKEPGGLDDLQIAPSDHLATIHAGDQFIDPLHRHLAGESQALQHRDAGGGELLVVIAHLHDAAKVNNKVHMMLTAGDGGTNLLVLSLGEEAADGELLDVVHDLPFLMGW